VSAQAKYEEQMAQADPGLDDLIDQLVEKRLQEKWGKI
jgi:hypothetical protein